MAALARFWNEPYQRGYDRPYQFVSYNIVSAINDQLCLDVAQEEQDNDKPHVCANSFDESNYNQCWQIAEASQAPNPSIFYSEEKFLSPYTIRNIGTGLYLYLDPKGSGYVLSIIPHPWWICHNSGPDADENPQYKDTFAIGSHVSREAGYDRVALTNEIPGTHVQVTKAEKYWSVRPSTFWRFRERQTDPEDLARSSSKLQAALQKVQAARVRAAAAIAVPVGEWVDEVETVLKLNKMSECTSGNKWKREAGGFRCGVGGHFVTDAQLSAI